MDIISELMNTLLPVPVDPAISKCGIAARSVTRMRPCKSRPIASVSLLGRIDELRRLDNFPQRNGLPVILGTSIPMVDFPGIRSIKIDSACNARHKSSVSPIIRLYLMPASGLNSNVVTTGPGLICVTRPAMSNSRHFSSIARARSLSSSSSNFWLRSPSRRREGEGSL